MRMSAQFFGFCCVLAFITLFTVMSSQAKEHDGVQMEELVKIGDKELTLNGMGTRKAMMVVKVYVAGLYLENKISNADEILKSSGVKQLVMEFKTAVDRSKLEKTLEESYAKNCIEKCSESKKDIDVLLSHLVDMKEKKRMVFTFFDDRVELNFSDSKRETINGAAFSRNLLAMYIGKYPPNESLKTGLLGR